MSSSSSSDDDFVLHRTYGTVFSKKEEEEEVDTDGDTDVELEEEQTSIVRVDPHQSPSSPPPPLLVRSLDEEEQQPRISFISDKILSLEIKGKTYEVSRLLLIRSSQVLETLITRFKRKTTLSQAIEQLWTSGSISVEFDEFLQLIITRKGDPKRVEAELKLCNYLMIDTTYLDWGCVVLTLNRIRLGYQYPNTYILPIQNVKAEHLTFLNSYCRPRDPAHYPSHVNVVWESDEYGIEAPIGYQPLAVKEYELFYQMFHVFFKLPYKIKAPHSEVIALLLKLGRIIIHSYEFHHF